MAHFSIEVKKRHVESDLQAKLRSNDPSLIKRVLTLMFHERCLDDYALDIIGRVRKSIRKRSQ